MSQKMIRPMEDCSGKEIFDNEIVSKYFISAVLKIPVKEIRKTKILNPFLKRIFPKNKEGILDVLVELTDGRKINIEIQRRQLNYWDKRSLYYLSKIFVQGIGRGVNYDKLKPCINISILDFNYLKTEKYHTIFRMRDNDGNDYSDALEIHIIEVRKLQKERENFSEKKDNLHQKDEDEYEEAVKEWIEFFKCEKEEDVDMLKLKTKNPGIKAAISELLSVNMSAELRSVHEERLKQKRDRAAREDFVREQGIEQGMERCLIQLVIEKMKKGFTCQKIAEDLEKGDTEIQQIMDVAEKYAPEYDESDIYKEYLNVRK